MNSKTVNANYSRTEWEGESPTMIHTHLTASTQSAETNGIHFAYRRFEIETGVPFLFM